MYGHEHDEQKRIEEPFEIEISDLGMSETVEGGKPSWLKHTFVDWQQISRRQRRGLASALGVLLLVVLVILLGLDTGLSSLFHSWVPPHPGMNSPGPLKIKPSVQILPQRDGFACTWDAAWSPDSKRIAVIGYQRTCGGIYGTYAPGQVAVYDAHSGRLVKRLMPDAAIVHALRSGSPEVRGAPEILYESVLWSPDGKYLTLLFSIGVPNESGPHFEGVLLSDEQSGRMRVMLQRDTNASPTIVEWDLEHGKPAKTVPVPSPIEAPFADVPPAFAYRWGRDGTLLPQMAVTNAKLPAKTPLDPVGNPAGGTSFTLWQSGQVLFDNRGKDGSIQRTGVLTWSTGFPAWSPDGRYLLNFIYVIGRLELPGQPRPSPQILASLQVGKAPLLAMRDMAFQRIVETMPEDLYSAGNYTDLPETCQSPRRHVE
jgi:WD40-like Beta Propeller Repeat